MAPTVSSEELKVIEQYARFEALKELLEDDIGESSPSQAEFTNVSDNHPAFKQLYLELRVAQANYKSRFVPGTITKEDFNEDASTYKFNDVWLVSVKEDFKKVNKAVVNFLDTKTATKSVSHSEEEKKFDKNVAEEVTKLVGKIKLESEQVTASIDEVYKRLQSVTDINPNQGQVYSNLQQQLFAVIDDKIPALISSLTAVARTEDQDTLGKVSKSYDQFEQQEKIRLYKLIHIIAEKTSSTQSNSSSRSGSKSESVHLKKVDPPKFSGDEIDFPEFTRKWLAVVGPANLPEEAEVDRLRDSLPKDAKEMLTGVSKVSKAWDILGKRYGDKDLIATKLKNELKGLTFKEKADHEKIIALVIKIRSLVTRLETLQASDALHYDGEFISAVYFQLPERQRFRWLEYDKSLHTDKWSALLAFLDDAYEKAVQEKLLLASYTPLSTVVKKGGAGASVLAVTVEDGGVDGQKGGGGAGHGHGRLSGKEYAQKKLEEVRKRVGKCPVCKGEHTFKSKWRPEPWPADRLIQCRKFNDMQSKQRAEVLEKVKGCARCTS